ncbi:MAG: NADAR family protein [Candidatus Paceibacterota bacterium]
MKVIDSFRGEHAFLSNFYACNISVGLNCFSSSEQMYQYYKTTDAKFRKLILSDGGNPSVAKRLGCKAPLHEDFEKNKLSIMYLVVFEKFIQNLDLRDRLLQTENAKLVEGNNWKDVFWGVCGGKGENHLGKILMQVRHHFQCCRNSKIYMETVDFVGGTLDDVYEKKSENERRQQDEKVVRNIAKCKKCGDVIESKYRHDFVQCKCGAIFVDGGHDYYRRGGNLEDFDEIDPSVD